MVRRALMLSSQSSASFSPLMRSAVIQRLRVPRSSQPVVQPKRISFREPDAKRLCFARANRRLCPCEPPVPRVAGRAITMPLLQARLARILVRTGSHGKG